MNPPRTSSAAYRWWRWRPADTAFTDTTAENATLKKENASLEAELESKSQESIEKRLREAQLHQEYQKAKALLDRIPKEVLNMYKAPKGHIQEVKSHEVP